MLKLLDYEAVGLAGVSVGFSAPKVASKGVYNTNICRKTGETCWALKASTLEFGILPP
jgi:hypothetical protein